MVHPSEIREAQRRQPFRPFVMHVADGRRFPIRHPEQMFVTQNGRTVVFEAPAGHVEMIDAVLVTSLGVPPEEPAGE